MRNKELIKSLAEGLESLSGETAAILTHFGGDPDSIGASYVLGNILRSTWRVRTLFKVPSDPSSHCKAFMERLGFEESEDIEGADAYVVVDCGSPEQLNEYVSILESGRKVMVIDHHSTSLESFAGKAEIFCSDAYQSVCEIVFDLSQYLGRELNLREAEALFAGTYYDTVRFSVADQETMKKICHLISLGVNPRELLTELEIKMDISERIARLKSATRMNIYRIRDWLIVTSTLGSFQSSSARSLLGLGAHVAIVAGESENGTVVAFRAVKDFIEATGVNLGKDLAAKIGEEMGGHGGGHSSAAKAHCMERDVEKVLSRCVELIGEKLGMPAEKIKP